MRGRAHPRRIKKINKRFDKYFYYDIYSHMNKYKNIKEKAEKLINAFYEKKGRTPHTAKEIKKLIEELKRSENE